MTTLQQAEAADHAQIEELDRLVIVKSVIYTSGERDPRAPLPRPPDQGKRYLMGHDPRLPRMPDKPTLFDFFRYRFGPAAHLLQSQPRLEAVTVRVQKLLPPIPGVVEYAAVEITRRRGATAQEQKP